MGWLREISGLRDRPGLVVGGGGVKVDTLVSGLTTMGKLEPGKWGGCQRLN